MMALPLLLCLASLFNGSLAASLLPLPEVRLLSSPNLQLTFAWLPSSMGALLLPFFLFQR
jgi:hypothetical protein